ncbi:hypothetical protein K488DRAFT_84179 [Vararia minispora EC-137]|uniref:Uncharacterized protein n=1 Tax=Vararia minispora EC-137 TaxID=1314806 RepID=A0ACB8QQT6_9AGAM|nr:hypothetical protein K488DRAFT_84179 [Vararia minispora EC-137]
MLQRFGKDLNSNINQVHTALQDNRISSLNRKSSTNSTRPRLSKSTDSTPLEAASAASAVATESADTKPYATIEGPFSASPASAPIKFSSIFLPMDPEQPPSVPSGAPPLLVTPTDISFPDPDDLKDKNGSAYERVKTFLKQFKRTYAALKYIFLLPVRLFFMFAYTTAKLAKMIILLPITVFVSIYEFRIRPACSSLPSILPFMNARPLSIRLQSSKDMTDAKVQSLQDQLPTPDINPNTIRTGADPSTRMHGGLSDTTRA